MDKDFDLGRDIGGGSRLDIRRDNGGDVGPDYGGNLAKDIVSSCKF